MGAPDMSTDEMATAWTSGSVTFAFDRDSQHHWIGKVTDAAGAVDDEPLHDAEMLNLLVTLTPAGETDGRKSWHVNIEGDMVNHDDVEGHSATTTRGHCYRNCGG